MPTRSYYFYSIFIIQSAIVFLGFAPSFYLKFLVADDPYYPGGLPVPHIVHGFILTIWYIFLVVQTRWISSNNVMIHKRMGHFGAAWAALVFLSTWWVIALFPTRLNALALESNSSVAELEPNLVKILWLDVFMSILFVAFIVVGIIRRQSPHIHKRVMLYSGLVFLFAASFRLGGLIGNLINNPVVGTIFGLGVLFILTASLLVHDYRQHRKILPVTWICFLLYWLAHGMSFVMAGSSTGAVILKLIGSK